MILALLLQAATPPPPTPPSQVPPVAMPPADWTPLPELPYTRRTAAPAEVSQFVRGEVVAGRCKAAVATAAGNWSLRIELAVQLGDGNLVRRIVPRAIQCPAVEQYASGLVLAMARGNVAGAAGWYRTALTFAWAG